MKNKSLLWRWLVLIGLCALSIWRAYPPSEQFNLGIDLQGGYRFVLGVDYDKMEETDGKAPSEQEKNDALQKALVVLRNRVDSTGTREASLYQESDQIVFEIPGIGTAQEREKLVDLIQQPAYLEFRIVHMDNDRLVGEKLFEPEIAPPGYILVRVEGRPYYQRDPEYTGLYDEEHKARVREFARVDTRHVLFLMDAGLGRNQENPLLTPVYVERKPQMLGDAIRRAVPRANMQDFGYEISLTLRPESAERFLNITRDYGPGGENENPRPNELRRMAIILDGTLLSAPNLTVEGGIAGGNASISGRFDFEEARRLAAALDSGALPAPIEIRTEQQVDPTLGADSIRQGVWAGIAGLALVIVFMFVYYLSAGLVVNMALVLDAILLPLGMFLAGGFLGIFGDGAGAGAANVNELPTLTLYGIAGLVLTIGMAVDANVLIFERLREEQKSGKRLVTSIKSAFEKAFSTIFDANITTLLVAVILFIQGSGPIRGFAVMLTAGILVSMYTALVFTRMGFDMLAMTKLEKIKMLSILPEDLNLDILSKEKVAFTLSGVLLIASVATVVIKGGDVLGIDFTGGTAIRYSLEVPREEAPSEEEIRDLLTAEGVGESVIQYQRALVEGEAQTSGQNLQVRVDRQFRDVVHETLDGAYGESMGLARVGMDDIGEQVGSDMRNRGIKAIVFALVGIVIYITIRFEFAFAIGTIAALVHDVIITLGIYFMLGHQLSLPIVAALLTIVGYSANDTIVVFDRVREDLKLLKGRPYREIANISINQTLSRTLLTSVTTLITIVMLLLFGGGAIYDFALALFIGVLVGTYSSTFVATPVMLQWHKEEKAS